MGKLIELLNQFEEEKKSDNRWCLSCVGNDLIGLGNIREARLAVISKGYGFIKWLVENDKIDFDNRELKDKFMEEFERYPTFHNNTYNKDFNINGLLMLLAISDTPIEDLVSYLK